MIEKSHKITLRYLGLVMSEVFLKMRFLTTQSGSIMAVTVVRISVTHLVIMLDTGNQSMKLMPSVKNCSIVSDVWKRVMIVAPRTNRTSGSWRIRMLFVVSLVFLAYSETKTPLANPQDSCRGELCRCEKDFVSEISKIKKTWTKKYHVDHGFDRKKECLKRGVQEKQEKQCCGKRLDYRLFNPNRQECCSDDTVATIGTCGY